MQTYFIKVVQFLEGIVAVIQKWRSVQKRRITIISFTRCNVSYWVVSIAISDGLDGYAKVCLLFKLLTLPDIL